MPAMHESVSQTRELQEVLEAKHRLSRCILARLYATKVRDRVSPPCRHKTYQLPPTLQDVCKIADEMRRRRHKRVAKKKHFMRLLRSAMPDATASACLKTTTRARVESFVRL